MSAPRCRCGRLIHRQSLDPGAPWVHAERAVTRCPDGSGVATVTVTLLADVRAGETIAAPAAPVGVCALAAEDMAAGTVVWLDDDGRARPEGAEATALRLIAESLDE